MVKAAIYKQAKNAPKLSGRGNWDSYSLPSHAFPFPRAPREQFLLTEKERERVEAYQRSVMMTVVGCEVGRAVKLKRSAGRAGSNQGRRFETGRREMSKERRLELSKRSRYVLGSCG